MTLEHSDSPGNVGLLARFRRILWPDIADRESAASTVRTMSKFVFGWAVLLIGIALLDRVIRSVAPPTSGEGIVSSFIWYAVGAGLVFGVIGWLLKRMSVAAAIV